MRLTLACATLLCIALLGCAEPHWLLEDEAQRPQALLDAYLVAHGMATSYAQSPGARRDVVLQLRTLDLKAAAAIRALAQPSGADVTATAQAVAALTDYAARQSVAPQ